MKTAEEMKEEKLGQEPAFPVESKEYGNVGINEIGMSKRFYAACAAMRGLFVNPHPIFVNAGMESLIKQAYYAADELLRQEEL